MLPAVIIITLLARMQQKGDALFPRGLVRRPEVSRDVTGEDRDTVKEGLAGSESLSGYDSKPSIPRSQSVRILAVQLTSTLPENVQVTFPNLTGSLWQPIGASAAAVVIVLFMFKKKLIYVFKANLATFKVHMQNITPHTSAQPTL